MNVDYLTACVFLCVCVSNGVHCMSQANVKAEKGVICGERDGTLPPGYRQADLVSWRSYIFLTFPFFYSFYFIQLLK